MNFTTAREYAPGIGLAVAARTISRKITRVVTPYKKTVKLARRDDMALDAEVAAWEKSNGFKTDGYEVLYGDNLLVVVALNVVGEVHTEDWADVAERVAKGSASLVAGVSAAHAEAEYEAMRHHLRQASTLMSGRHLQHGDETQATRNIEVFTNCSTAAATFLSFYLLLNGSGVGRAYDDKMIRVDFNMMPIVVPVIAQSHADCQSGEIRRAGIVNDLLNDRFCN